MTSWGYATFPPRPLARDWCKRPAAWAAWAAATEYLHLMGYVAVGWQWLRMVTVAKAKLAAGTGDARFLEAKIKTARFYMVRMLPEAAALLTAIQSGAGPIMAMSADEF